VTRFRLFRFRGFWFKLLMRWVILGGSLFFLGKVLKDHWQQVAAVRVTIAGWACLAIALGVTLLAHITAGWVWNRLLQDFHQPVPSVWMIQAYLKTNIAKYLPGNIWHYYGRITAATGAGASLEAATVSVLLEPLLMVAAALTIILTLSQCIAVRYGLAVMLLQWLSLVLVLAAVHPIVLNPLLHRLRKLKQKATASTTLAATTETAPFTLKHYPLIPFLGELGFLLLRGMGFLLTFWAVSPIALTQLPLLLSAFSLAWLLGLLVPGAPGGIGVFEATMIALLGASVSPGMLLSVVALYRLISVMAEAVGAGLAWLAGDRLRSPSTKM